MNKNYKNRAVIAIIAVFFAGCSLNAAPGKMVLEENPPLESRNLAPGGEIPVSVFYPSNELGFAEARDIATEQAEQMAKNGRIGQGSRVLEVGTGSGYEAAYFSFLGAKVFSVEIVPDQAEIARMRLSSVGVGNVEILVGDGWQGWAEKAPFDAIVVRASSPQVPLQLLEQLANRGRLIVPIEYESKNRTSLLVVERSGDDFLTYVGESLISTSRLTGKVRKIPKSNVKTSTQDSLIEKLLEGDAE